MTGEIRVVSTYQLLLADRQDDHISDVCILTGANFFLYVEKFLYGHQTHSYRI